MLPPRKARRSEALGSDESQCCDRSSTGPGRVPSPALRVEGLCNALMHEHSSAVKLDAYNDCLALPTGKRGFAPCFCLCGVAGVPVKRTCG